MIKFLPGQWEGLDTLGEEELRRLRAPAEAGVTRAGMHLMNAVKRTLSGSRSGRFYRVSRKGRLHQASAPGEPPAVLFGKLRQSIATSKAQWDGWSVEVEVGTNVPYARRMEWGGVDRRGVRILPRPYFGPTALKEQDALDRILESVFK